MTNLSPAALAVLEAAEKQTDLDFRYAPQIAAAALRAAALVCKRDKAILLSLADELEGNHTSENDFRGGRCSSQ